MAGLCGYGVDRRGLGGRKIGILNKSRGPRYPGGGIYLETEQLTSRENVKRGRGWGMEPNAEGGSWKNRAPEAEAI